MKQQAGKVGVGRGGVPATKKYIKPTSLKKKSPTKSIKSVMKKRSK